MKQKNYEEYLDVRPNIMDRIGTLELAMANSAFGYEYALQALSEEDEFGMRAEQLRGEMENLKDAYFMARQQLQSLDSFRLEVFEISLQAEKSVIFSRQESLH